MRTGLQIEIIGNGLVAYGVGHLTVEGLGGGVTQGEAVEGLGGLVRVKGQGQTLYEGQLVVVGRRVARGGVGKPGLVGDGGGATALRDRNGGGEAQGLGGGLDYVLIRDGRLGLRGPGGLGGGLGGLFSALFGGLLGRNIGRDIGRGIGRLVGIGNRLLGGHGIRDGRGVAVGDGGLVGLAGGKSKKQACQQKHGNQDLPIFTHKMPPYTVGICQ